MSTSVTHSGTTTSAGRPGRGIGVAAAALALVIAAGVVFTVNQGSDSVSEQVQGPGAYSANYPNELDRINDLGAKMAAESHPAFNIERTKMAMAGQLDNVSGTPYIPNSTVDDMVPAGVAKPVTNIEWIRMRNAGELDVDTTSVVEQRFAHEFLEEQRTPVSGTEDNPLEGIAE